MPEVERKINDLLLRLVFFPTKCGGASGGELSLRHNRRLDVVGVSSYPLEEVMEGVECQLNKTDATNDCVVCAGGLRIFFDGNRTDERDRALQIIKTAMNAGEFNSLRDAIVRVTFISISIDSFGTRNADPQSPDTVGNDDGGLSTGAFVGMALGGLLGLLAMLLGCCFLRKSKDGENEQDEGEDENSPLNLSASDSSFQ